MRLTTPAVLALGISICDAKRGALRKAEETAQRFYNISSSTSGIVLSTRSDSRHARPRSSPQTTAVLPSSTTVVASTNSTFSSPYISYNHSCDQRRTINVPQAFLEWWYPYTIYDTISIFSSRYNNDSSSGWTVIPATRPFDLDSTLSLWSTGPIAARTTAITQVAYKTLNATSGSGQIPNVVITPPPATVAIPSNGPTFTESTSFVYFSGYEVISESPLPYDNGRTGCATFTKTLTMATPFAFPYTGAHVSNSSALNQTGNLPPDFLQSVNETSVVAGSWTAAPTVIAIVQEVFAAQIAFTMSNAFRTPESTLLVPTWTVPSFFSPVPARTTEQGLPTGNPQGQTETTETFLLVPTPAKTTSKGGENGKQPATQKAAEPQRAQTALVSFVAHVDHGDITFVVPANPTKKVITTELNGGRITATRVQPQPMNAVQVLSEALDGNDGSKPTTPPSHNSNSGAPSKVVHVIVIGKTTFTANSNTEFHLSGSKTLTPGGTVVLSGTTLSLLPDASSIVINGHTKPVSTATITPAPPITINGHVFPANSASAYDINGHTLAPGDHATVTIHGKKYILSLAPDGTMLEIEKLGSNGVVTATVYETLVIAGRWKEVSITSTIGAAHAQTRSNESGSRRSGLPTAKLQNAASVLKIELGVFGLAFGLNVLTRWL